MRVPSPRPIGVTALFERLGECFVQGRLAEAAGFWSFPSPIMIDGHLEVMRRPSDLIAFMAAGRGVALAAGLVALRPLVVAIEMPRLGRLRVWLRWCYDFHDRTEEETHGSVYYMVRSSDGRLSIEMMDIVAIPFPLPQIEPELEDA